MLKKSGELVTYRRCTFSFSLRSAIKDKNVLSIIKNFLGGIGKIIISKEEKFVFLVLSSREDIDKLLKLMYNHFCRLNTTKVLDFLS